MQSEKSTDVSRSSPIPSPVIRSVGVVVPAHNEEASILDCIRSIDRAADFVRSAQLDVFLVIVCDACTDRTAQLVTDHGLTPVLTDGRNVGSARARGAQVALRRGAEWLAFTDADTIVCANWLQDQLSIGADAVCGTIGISDWGVYGKRMHEHFLDTYTDADGHRHVHGANIGLSARAYRQIGGFQPLTCHEDVALVDALIASNIDIAWSAKPRVWTSARKTYRAPDGFGATLERVANAFCDGVAKTGAPHALQLDTVGGVAA